MPSAYRRGRFDPKALRERIRVRLTSRFGLRLHMTALLALVFAAAFLTTRVLFLLHVRSMGVRYLVASILGYAAFFGLLRAWLWYVAEEVGAEITPDHAPDEVALAVEPDGEVVPPSVAVVAAAPVAPRKESSSSGGSSSGISIPDLGDGDGCVAVIIVAIVATIGAVLFGAAGYVIYQAPALLGEAVFELVIASVLARSSRQVTREGWSGSVFAATWKPALLMMATVTIGGFAAQGLCPTESTMGRVIRVCVLDQK